MRPLDSPDLERHEPPRPGASNRRRWGVGVVSAVVVLILAVAAIGAINNTAVEGGTPSAQATYAPLAQPDDDANASGPDSPASTTSIAEVSTTAPLPTSTTSAAPTAVSTPVFAATSPFNAPIGSDPALDPNSDQIATYLGLDVVADLYEFGIAIYEVDESTPPVAVDCTKNWGTCPLERDLHRIPEDAQPAPGDDGTLVVIDWAERRTVELWQAVQRSEELWSSSWGTTTPIDGNGIPDVYGNGAGVSHLAGVIRVGEIAQGRIDHALVFSTNNACRNDYRFPATKTDGQSTRVDCVLEGARIQLDPALDLNGFDFTPAERTIAQALQTYGAYAIDIGGATMAFYFEIAGDATPTHPGSVYTEAGLSKDYFGLDAIPWEHLRVLDTWDGE